MCVCVCVYTRPDKIHAISIYDNKKLGFISHLKTRYKMALGKNYSLGLVKRTSSFGRKRILILNEMDIDSINAISPTKKRSMGNNFSPRKSLLEALPQDILIRILCGVEHDDLKKLFHVSKPIREAEEDPGWYSRAANFISEPVVDVEMNHNVNMELPSKNEISLPETKTIPHENGNSVETHDKDVMVEGLSSVVVYDQWVDPPVSGQRPKPRYEHAAAVIDDKMYIFGGNHNGRYLNDLQVEVKPNSEAPVTVTPCAGHSLIPWEGNKLISIAGHSKDPFEVINDLEKWHSQIWKSGLPTKLDLETFIFCYMFSVRKHSHTNLAIISTITTVRELTWNEEWKRNEYRHSIPITYHHRKGGWGDLDIPQNHWGPRGKRGNPGNHRWRNR
ncbi:hypothetical protein LXL04_003199 [Taraxacum kok-saghyz]